MRKENRILLPRNHDVLLANASQWPVWLGGGSHSREHYKFVYATASKYFWSSQQKLLKKLPF